MAQTQLAEKYGPRVLIVDDEEDILELVRYNLDKAGYLAFIAASGEEAIALLRSDSYDLVVLDLMLPGINGLEVCRLIREGGEHSGLPIVLLSARGEESDIVTGLELGADDYVTKPFSPKELIARVRAVLRRKDYQEPEQNVLLTIHGVTINPTRHEVLIGNQKLELTATEFKLLAFLARRPGWVFTRYQIVDAVRGEDCAVTERSVDVQVVGLRRKLGALSEIIETVRGVGYRMRDLI